MRRSLRRMRGPGGRSWARRMLARAAVQWTERLAAFRAEWKADLEKMRQRAENREETVTGLLVAQLRELKTAHGELRTIQGDQARQIEELRRHDDELFALLDSERGPW